MLKRIFSNFEHTTMKEGMIVHNIVIADDHPLFRDAIRGVLLNIFPDVNILESQDVNSTLAITTQNPDIDLVLLDLNMDGMDGFNGIVKIRNKHPDIPVVVVSSEENRSTVLQTITCGAIGFISKSTEGSKIEDALMSILDGQIYLPPDIIRSSDDKAAQERANASSAHPPLEQNLVATLTRRQLLVLEHIVLGQSNKQISYDLDIAETTVKAHVSAILNKLKVNNRIQAALRSSQLNFDHLLNRI